jgi:hypothetical protein
MSVRYRVVRKRILFRWVAYFIASAAFVWLFVRVYMVIITSEPKGFPGVRVIAEAKRLVNDIVYLLVRM